MIWLFLLLLVCCSGAVSGSETALFALSPRSLLNLRNSPSTLRRRIELLMRSPQDVLMTVLIANTLINVAIFAVSYVALRDLGELHPYLTAVGGIVTLLAVILFGEITPKALALSHAEFLALPGGMIIGTLKAVLKPIRVTLGALVVHPLVRLLSPQSATGGAVSTEELHELIRLSADEGVVDTRENYMLQAVVALEQVRVREIMCPRVDIRAVRITDAPAAILKSARNTRRPTLLVVGRDLDDIRGEIAVRDILLRPRVPTTRRLRPIHFVPEQINVLQLLNDFTAAAVDRAVVVDEYGGTSGLVALEDAVERIVGDLPGDEGVETPPVTEQIDENTYRLAGGLSVRQWAERLGVRDVDPHVDTVAGLVLARLGRLPQVGDTVRLRNLSLTVERMQRRRIVSVLLHRESRNGRAGDKEPSPPTPWRKGH